MAKPYQIRGCQLNTSASIGIGLYPENGTDAQTLVRGSDAAKYCAKKAGHNKYYIAESRAGESRGKTASPLFG